MASLPMGSSRFLVQCQGRAEPPRPPAYLALFGSIYEDEFGITSAWGSSYFRGGDSVYK